MSTIWKKIKKSGNYYRSLATRRSLLLQRARQFDQQKNINHQQHACTTRHPTSELFEQSLNITQVSTSKSIDIPMIDSIDNEFDCLSCESEESSEDEGEVTKNQNLRKNLRKWAVEFRVNHSALKSLIAIINERFEKGARLLPENPRTFLQTPHSIKIQTINDGEYWHNGLENCLKELFSHVSESKTISININIDGLPLFKSSKTEFWPILFNITEMPRVPAMVIGIFCGKSKCSNLESFLSPFVNEVDKIMKNDIIINNHKITVLIRCFICDSPARAFIKGVAYFNSQHGCLKCTTLGEYSHISHTNIFPRTLCEPRTNEKFRKNAYGSHHKAFSPLMKLDIDMIQQFPVGDELHLLHLGIMKRLLFGWRDGTFRNSDTKWRAETTSIISDYLKQCKMPSEFHRVVRGLDCLSYWKGTEYRTFLYYVGIVALKDHLTSEAYNHFLLLFCSVTICSSKQYFTMLPVAREMIIKYIEIYSEIYGVQYITSNVHNLVHLVDEVERFGELSSFSAYPFESMLGQIKGLLRNGNQPLAQIAKRMTEDRKCSDLYNDHKPKKTGQEQHKSFTLTQPNNGMNIPVLLKPPSQSNFYSKIQFDNLQKMRFVV